MAASADDTDAQHGDSMSHGYSTEPGGHRRRQRDHDHRGAVKSPDGEPRCGCGIGFTCFAKAFAIVQISDGAGRRVQAWRCAPHVAG